MTQSMAPAMTESGDTETGSAFAPAGAITSGGAERMLWLSRLSVTQFRCYAKADLQTDDRPVILVGPNGAGKTNLLEAISFLSPGRGLRRAKLTDVDRRPSPTRDQEAGVQDASAQEIAVGENSPAWAVAVEIMTPDGPRHLGTGRDPAPANGDTASRERRVIKIDGDFARSQQALGEIVSVVWLTPQMDGLFRDGTPARRRFLDRLVYGFDPAHAGRINAYEQALRERARLLKSGGGDNTWIGALEETMARHGIAIAAARRSLVARLSQACNAGVGPFPVAGLGLSGDVETWLDDKSALQAEDELRAQLAAARRRDAETGGAALGPHRSDLTVQHLDKALPATSCSTGEQKALLVSIVLAHARLLAAERGTAPLLLLDEVAAHLDQTRRRSLYEEILGLGAQTWLTGTDLGVFAELRQTAQFFDVQDAVIKPSPMV